MNAATATIENSGTAERVNPPLAVGAAALLAIATMAMTRRDIIMPVVVALAIGASWVTAMRLPAGSKQVWILRLALYAIAGIIILATPLPNSSSLAISVHTIDFLMLACAGEMAVQFWQRPTLSGSSAVLILFSGLAFTAASKTLETQLMPYFTPLYISVMILALQSVRQRTQQSNISTRLLWMRRFFVVIALSFGLVSATLIYRYRMHIERTGLDLAMALQSAPERSVGFSSSPVLGQVQTTEKSMTRILRIDGDCPDEHLRGTAFYDYMKGGRWDPPSDNRTYEVLHPRELKPGAKGERIEITRLTEDLDMLFLPLHSAGVQVNENGSLRRDIRGASTLLYSSISSPVSYTALLTKERDLQGPLCIPLEGNERQRCVDIPDSVEAPVLQLAKQIARSERDPLKKIAAVENYLRTNHEYSLTTDPGKGDPVSNFLLKKKAAHCEYFASAAVILLRCLNVPARYVSGFYAHEFAGTNRKIVRARDAHAWTEAWVDGIGWVTVDATPPSGMPDSLAEAPTIWRRAGEWLSDTARDILAAPLWKKALALAVAGSALAFFISRRRRKVREKKALMIVTDYTKPGESVTAMAMRFDLLLQERNISCPPHLTWSEHLGSLSGSALARGIHLDKVRSFLAEYNALRFGKLDEAQALGRLGALLSEIER